MRIKTLGESWLRAWYQGAIWFMPLLIVLWPLSLVFSFIAARRRALLQNQLQNLLQTQQQTLPVPIVVVGNISIGGTGKTPLLCLLAQKISAQGLRVGIISRGYGGSYTGAAHLLQINDEAALVGDEPLLLARNTGCPVVIGRDRFTAAQYLCEQHVVDVILSDDGLQHYRLPRDIEIAVLDGMRGLGNGFCLPAGPLREPPSRLQQVDFVVVNGASEKNFRTDQVAMTLQPVCWKPIAGGAEKGLDLFPPGTRVHAVAGIGNPQRFFATLRALRLDVIEHAFADHHPFVASDVQFADAVAVVMTEKDAVKCRYFADANMWALPVQAHVPDSFIDALMEKIQQCKGRRV